MTEGRTVGAEEMQGVKGATTPYLRRRGSTGGRRESTKRVGLPPSGPEGSLQRDRCVTIAVLDNMLHSFIFFLWV